MSFESLIPAAFPALALAHFVALLSPGQDFFLIAAHAVRHRLDGSRYICVGVALGNAIYIAVAILGWSGIRDLPWLFSTIEILGAGYLGWIGIQLLRSRPAELSLETTATQAPPGRLRQLLLGLNSALLNPKNALFYMSLMTVILGSEVSLTQQLFCGAWMVLAVLGWDLLVASMIGQQRVQHYLRQRLHWFERSAGVVLMGFGMGLLTQSASR
ncbi:LysE family translocator [Motiliproteus coralliicola]|uniref:LysE family translocator n=1 Tax=Motiliproteus coralliicola TaxID=2283196 RepID=A0A369WCI8_9GAMM|nr:LysE family transporter [Motiliproteus coralliicola]RDE18404.1 LysE family translocator [Motiliproteus coralliicola]